MHDFLEEWCPKLNIWFELYPTYAAWKFTFCIICINYYLPLSLSLFLHVPDWLLRFTLFAKIQCSFQFSELPVTFPGQQLFHPFLKVYTELTALSKHGTLHLSLHLAFMSFLQMVPSFLQWTVHSNSRIYMSSQTCMHREA